MGMAIPRITSHYLGGESALLWLCPLRRGCHWLPRTIAKPITVHILCRVYVKNSLGNARILQHIFRSWLQRQRLRLGQVEASRLILFAVEDRDRYDAAGFWLPCFACPFEDGDGAHRGRRFLDGL